MGQNGVEAVVFSHYAAVDRDFVASLALLYDRVIFPLADWSASENLIARDLRQHCPALKRLQEAIRPLREGQSPLCWPLTSSDTPLASESCESFRSDFDHFLRMHGLDWSTMCQSHDLNRPFQTLHGFVARSLLTQRSPRQRVKLLYTEPLAFAPTLAQKLAAILAVELKSFAIPSVEVDPNHIANLHHVLEGCPARSAYRQELFGFAEALAAKLRNVESEAEQREIVLDRINALKLEYDAWIEKLKPLVRIGWLRIRDKGDNILHVSRCRFWFSKFTLKSGVKGFFEAAIDVECQPLATRVRDEPALAAAVGRVTWQHYLLAIQTRVDAMMNS